MNEYELYFYLLLAFIAGRVTKGLKIYIGPDEDKYDAATLGMLIRPK